MGLRISVVLCEVLNPMSTRVCRVWIPFEVLTPLSFSAIKNPIEAKRQRRHFFPRIEGSDVVRVSTVNIIHVFFISKLDQLPRSLEPALFRSIVRMQSGQLGKIPGALCVVVWWHWWGPLCGCHFFPWIRCKPCKTCKPRHG